MALAEFQLVVLDIMMPGMYGFSTLEKIRTISKVAVLMLTSKTENTDKIRGLRSGAYFRDNFILYYCC